MTVRKQSPELVLMTRTLGNQLAALREAAGIVQQQVAHKTGYSRSSVAKAESGRQLLTPEFWRTADELLKAEGALLASYEQVRDEPGGGAGQGVRRGPGARSGVASREQFVFRRSGSGCRWTGGADRTGSAAYRVDGEPRRCGGQRHAC
jgi:transcriptional regulator with XRE-family HTH domain